MTPQEYTDLLLNARDTLYDAIRAALPAEVEMEKRFIVSGENVESGWLAELVNRDTDKIRIFILRMQNLSAADEAATAGGKNFKPSMRLVFELIHDYLIDTNEEDTQAVFDRDAILLQFAIETTKNLPPKGCVKNYQINLGTASGKNRNVHYGRGEINIDFREIRYDL